MAIISTCCKAEIKEIDVSCCGFAYVCSKCGKECTGDEVCGDCMGTGIVVENAGYCGGCDRCGMTEEREVACHCSRPDHDNDRSDE